MQGTYDGSLVLLSILIAALASYVAFEFAGRIFERPAHRNRWLFGGALAMGSGIWSMHFIGMAAFELPISVSYDLAITVVSWLAAVAVSALALWLVSSGPLSAGKVSVGALVMGAGICAMHYLGMGAMQMQPGIGYDPFWLVVSVLIAVGASAAALVIVSALRTMRSWRDLGMRIGAAGIMGLAVAGMHYSGMAAARFAPGAMCSTANTLQGDSLVVPTVVVAVLGMVLALAFALTDTWAVVMARRRARDEARRVVELAFLDQETGLMNRPKLSQLMADALRGDGRLAVLSLRLAAIDDAAARRATTVRLAAALPGVLGADAELARTSPDQLMVLLTGAGAEAHARRLLPRLRQTANGLTPGMADALQVGMAVAPMDGDSPQMLMLRAGSENGEQCALGRQADDDGPDFDGPDIDGLAVPAT